MGRCKECVVSYSMALFSSRCFSTDCGEDSWNGAVLSIYLRNEITALFI